jgi:hypothetical protein
MIVDAGGGTIDISTYSKSSSITGRHAFEEIAVPSCAIAILCPCQTC